MTNEEFTNLLKLFMSKSKRDQELAAVLFDINKDSLTIEQVGEFSMLVLFNYTLCRNTELEFNKTKELYEINGLFHETIKKLLKEKGYI